MSTRYYKGRGPNNIKSGMAASILLKMTSDPDDPTDIAEYQLGRMIVTLRYCTIGGERSGGAVVTIRHPKLSTYRHDGWVCRPWPTRRLPGGFNERRLRHAVGRTIIDMEDLIEIGDKREKFYVYMKDKCEVSQAELERIAEEGREQGFCSRYVKMTEDDLDYWWKAFGPNHSTPVTQSK